MTQHSETIDGVEVTSLTTAGALLNLSADTVRRWVTLGKLTAIRRGGSVRVPLAEVEAEVAARAAKRGRK